LNQCPNVRIDVKIRSKYAKPCSICRWLFALAALVAVILIAGCQQPVEPPALPALSDEEMLTRAVSIIERIAEDARLCHRETVFNINAAVDNGRVTLTGETTERQLKESICSAISGIHGAKTVDQVTMLPDPELGEKVWAVVKEPVINLGDAPGQAEGKNTVTQARMGDVMHVLAQNDGWYLVQMEDNYLGWVDPGSVALYDPASLDDFWCGQVALIAAKMTEAMDKPNGRMLFNKWLVQGSVLPLASIGEKWAELSLPGGGSAFARTGSIKVIPDRDSVFAEQKAAADVIATAQQYAGLPYLWGGCTSYGFDCSGFTQFCMKMNGYHIRRDADMQYEQGTPVKSVDDLKPGDLVFFETYRPGPSHVGIYIGDYRYVHAGSSAGVAVNSFSPSHTDYSASLAGKFLEGRRIIK